MAEENVSPKIEPTLKAIEDAPSIVAAAPDAPLAEAAKSEVKADAPPKVEAAAEPPKVEASVAPAKIEVAEPPKAEIAAPAARAPQMPRAAQLKVEPPAKADAPISRGPIPAQAKPAPAAASSRGNGRFTLLAACVAIAASLGAVAGSFGAAKFGRAPTDEITGSIHVSREANEEIKALKETVAQLRTSTKALSENLASLKLSAANSTAQLTKMTETLDRIDHAQADRRAAAAPAAPEVTGSIAKPVPMVLGTPPAALQHPIVQGWILRRVYDGTALIEGREGIIEVEPGTMLPGLGRIEDIKKQDGRWVVLTSKGLIVSASK